MNDKIASYFVSGCLRCLLPMKTRFFLQMLATPHPTLQHYDLPWPDLAREARRKLDAQPAAPKSRAGGDIGRASAKSVSGNRVTVYVDALGDNRPNRPNANCILSQNCISVRVYGNVFWFSADLFQE